MKQPDLEQKNSARSAEVEELKGLLRDKEDSIKLKETELKVRDFIYVFIYYNSL